MRALRNVSLAVAMLFTAGGASALNYDVFYTETPPAIDGVATDGAWSDASPAATNFVQHNDADVQSNEQTNVRLLWDDNYLYVSYEAADGQVVPGASGDDDFLFTGIDTAEFFFDPSWRQATSQNDKIYHIVVDPSEDTYTYTEAGQNELGWDLGPDTEFAFSSGAMGWTVEGKISWDDFNSTGTNSPGILAGAPYHNVVWGAQFGRVHSMDTMANNAGYTKWQPTEGGFRQRPFGTLTFKGTPGQRVTLTTGTEVFSTSFEAPTYTTSQTVVGIDGFASTSPDTFTAFNEHSFMGDQSLRIEAGPARILNQEARTVSSLPQYVQYALRLPREDIVAGSYRHVIYLQAIFSPAQTNNTFGQIWIRNGEVFGSNNIGVVSYEDPENPGTSTVTNIPGLQAYDTWIWVTIKATPDDKTFEVWINNTKLKKADGSDKFGVRVPTAFQQMAYPQFYSKNFGTEPVYLDDLTFVLDETQSDVSDWQLY